MARRAIRIALTTGLASVYLLAARAAPADLVGIVVEYRDQTTSQSDPHGGPVWEGVVDTLANTLSIYSWGELPGHGSDFWIPSFAAGPLVWDAVDSQGQPFDVPNSFGEGGVVSIGDDWGFLSPETANQMDWAPAADGTERDYAIVPSSDYYPGWGAVSFQEAVAPGSTDTHFVLDVTADETTLPQWPIHEFGFRASLGATVSVLGLAEISSVPEVSPPLVGSLLSLAVACRSLLKRRRA